MSTAEFTPSSAPSSPSPIGVLSDEALGALVASGDDRAFELLYERYSAPLFRYCRAILRSAEDAEEAFQATMLNAYRALSRGDRAASFRPWLYQIAHNQCVSLIRGRRPAEALDGREIASSQSVHEQVELQESVRQLRLDLDSLPPQQRSALVMREMSGLSHRAIGQALATSSNDARQLVYEARQSLAEFSAGRELACDDVRSQIFAGDRRRLRARRMRAHLRSCNDCGALAAAQTERRRALAGFMPLVPALLTYRILEQTGVAAPAGAPAGFGGAVFGSGSGAPQAGTAAGTVAGIGSLAAGGLFGGAGTTAGAGSGALISGATAGGMATAGAAALSLVVAAAVTFGGGPTPPALGSVPPPAEPIELHGVLLGRTTPPAAPATSAPAAPRATRVATTVLIQPPPPYDPSAGTRSATAATAAPRSPRPVAAKPPPPPDVKLAAPAKPPDPPPASPDETPVTPAVEPAVTKEPPVAKEPIEIPPVEGAPPAKKPCPGHHHPGTPPGGGEPPVPPVDDPPPPPVDDPPPPPPGGDPPPPGPDDPPDGPDVD